MRHWTLPTAAATRHPTSHPFPPLARSLPKEKVPVTLHFFGACALCTSQHSLLRFTNKHGEVPCTGVERRTAASSRWGRPVRGRHPGALRCPVCLLHGACKRMDFLCLQYLFVRNITVTIAASTIPPHVCPTPTKRCSVHLHMMRNECVGGATACSRREVMRATLFPCRFAPFWFRPRCILSAGIFAVGVLALPVSHIVTLDSTLP